MIFAQTAPLPDFLQAIVNYIASINWANGLQQITGPVLAGLFGLISSALGVLYFRIVALEARPSGGTSTAAVPAGNAQRVSGQFGPDPIPTLESLELGGYCQVVMGFFGYDLSAGTLPTGLTAASGSGGYAFNAAGNFVPMPAPRFDYSGGTLLGLLVEPGTTNYVRNSSGQDAVAGTPGTLPANWSIVSDLAVQNLGPATQDGLQGFKVRLSGTTSQSTITINFDSATGIAASGDPANPDTWAVGVYAAFSAGSLTNISGHRVILTEKTSAGVTVQTDTGSAQVTTLTGVSKRVTDVFPLTGGSIVGAVQPGFRATLASGATAIDITYFFAVAQAEKSSVPTTGVVTAGAPASRTADVINFKVNKGFTSVTYTFDDGSLAGVPVLPGQITAIPSNLARNHFLAVDGLLTILARPGA